MATHKSALLLFSLLAAFTMWGCRAGTDRPVQTTASAVPESGVLRVVAGVLPAKYLVEQVGGAAVQVDVMVPPGREPHTYEPTPQQMTELSHAQLYVRTGMPFEDVLLPRISSSSPRLTVVDLRTNVPLRTIDGSKRLTLAPGSPAADILDPHIWLGPRELAIEAQTIRDALGVLRPDKWTLFTNNYESFVERLHAVDAKLSAMLAPLRGRSILVFHPAFGYFTDTYGISQLAIETNGRDPGPRELLELIKRARDAGIRSVFVEPEFSETTARRIAESLGVSVVVVNPLAPDILANLETMARAFLAGSSPATSP
ncbi:MAG TPA: zinc ABC transporter substrate-binding protein [Spirochaetia bacterium]|nr:zinc ABC transporter substrate-binding protein [Spirochaetia bacterium]